ncbi:MAG: aldo/keto reductase [Myxococcales bacterium]|nr:aldo/keto reductase [Myxococcales bacterium]
MNTRPLGRTGLSVSEVGFGAWAIGGGMWGAADDATSIAALERAIDLGVNLIDTALVYGEGRSERLIGEVVRRRPEKIVVCSKVPPMNFQWPARADTPLRDVFPARHIRFSCEQSLSHLGLDCIDVLQLHVFASAWATENEWWDEMQALRAEGKIRHVGISLNDHQPGSGLEVIRRGRVEVVQVIHNIFDQSPEDALYPACLEHGVGVLARVPLDESALGGRLRLDTVFPPGDFRSRYFAGQRLAETVERVEKLRWLERPGRTLAQAALGFVLGHPALSSVIPGIRNPRQAEENTAAAEAGRLTSDERTRLREHRWDRSSSA